jgi:predicted DNA binding CopG/RHH family protein
MVKIEKKPTKDQMISLRISQSDLEKLDVLAKKAGVSRGSYIEALILDQIQKTTKRKQKAANNV